MSHAHIPSAHDPESRTRRSNYSPRVTIGTASGPLAGLRVVELASLGPGPHAAMMLADLGADVVRLERPNASTFVDPPMMSYRGRRRIVCDLKSASEVADVLHLVERADILLEGMRPGVAERLGVGPDACHAANPRLIYARVTGWGQEGPLAQSAGHDLNYIGLAGVLAAIGSPSSPPPPPLNLVGDFGGGSMLVLVGILSALWERSRSGLGQVIDAAMVDGASMLAQMVWGLRATGLWSDDRQSNLLDGGVPFYACYRCADGGYVAVAALEPQFYSHLITGLGLPPTWLAAHSDRTSWPALRETLTAAFGTRTRDDWVRIFADVDACVTPVLTFEEAARNEHLLARGTLITDDPAAPMPAPAPRFSRTPSQSRAQSKEYVALKDVLADWA